MFLLGFFAGVVIAILAPPFYNWIVGKVTKKP